MQSQRSFADFFTTPTKGCRLRVNEFNVFKNPQGKYAAYHVVTELDGVEYSVWVRWSLLKALVDECYNLFPEKAKAGAFDFKSLHAWRIGNPHDEGFLAERAVEVQAIMCPCFGGGKCAPGATANAAVAIRVGTGSAATSTTLTVTSDRKVLVQRPGVDDETVEWSPSAFGGDALWEYTMVFSEDFSHIQDGQVKATRVNGEAGATHNFGGNRAGGLAAALMRLREAPKLQYERYDEARGEIAMVMMRQREREERSAATRRRDVWSDPSDPDEDGSDIVYR